MSQHDRTAAKLDAAATVRAYGGSLADLERAAYGYVADRIRESGELVTVELGAQRMADFVESLAIQLDPDGLCACCGDSDGVSDDMCPGCRDAGCAVVSATDCTPGDCCPIAKMIRATRERP